MTASHDAPDPQALARFLSGECSFEESAAVEQWAQAAPAHGAELESLRAAWIEAGRATPSGVGSWGSQAVWSGIAAQLGEDAVSSSLRLVRHSPVHGMRAIVTPSRAWRRIGAVAAAVVLAMVGRWAFLATTSGATTADETAREYRTARGQRASFRLPDGSAVQLGPQSVLRIASAYGGSARIVTLQGDAYFHVTHDDAHPFAVRTAQGEVRDLGTRFVVRARSGEVHVDVAVAEGRVSIGRRNEDTARRIGAMTLPALPADSLVLTAGEFARMEAHGGLTPIHVASVEPYFAWTQGQLVFDRTPLSEVLAELNRWYDQEFVLADPSMATIRLTTVLRGETLSEALLVLRTSLAVQTRVDGHRVMLTPRVATGVRAR